MTATLQGTDEPLTQVYDVAMLDLDGVVYIGPDAVDGAAQALAAARSEGLRLAFVTNNAARPPDVVAAHLQDLGIDASTDEVVTSAQAAARHLAGRLPAGARVLVVGTTGLHRALEEQGLVPASTADDVAALVQGYSPELNWALLAEGAVAINSGVPWVATNTDATVPSPRGPLPGNGSLVAALERATGRRPDVTGKPDPTMHRETLIRTNSQRPIVVGDRLDTDIEGANNVGCASLLVLTGVTGARDLLLARPALRPTYLAEDVRGLLVAHPQPRRSGDAVECGRWRVDSGTRELVLTQAGGSDRTGTGPGAGEDGSEDRIDALRALCAAAWGPAGSATGPGADRSEGKAVEFDVRAEGAAAREALEALKLA